MRNSETVWTFKTARFTVALSISYDYGYRYDGDDENGETQALLDAGDMVAFDSCVTVELDGIEISADHLGGSVYYEGDVPQFWTAHRDSDPYNRNCTLYRDEMRAKTGHECAICHYFPDMVKQAISEARTSLTDLPYLRAA